MIRPVHTIFLPFNLLMIAVFTISITWADQRFFSAHVLSFRNQSDADRAVGVLSARGVQAFHLLQNETDESGWYNIYVGMAYDRIQVVNYAAALKKRGYISYYLVKEIKDQKPGGLVADSGLGSELALPPAIAYSNNEKVDGNQIPKIGVDGHVDSFKQAGNREGGGRAMVRFGWPAGSSPLVSWDNVGIVYIWRRLLDWCNHSVNGGRGGMKKTEVFFIPPPATSRRHHSLKDY